MVVMLAGKVTDVSAVPLNAHCLMVVTPCPNVTLANLVH